MKKLVVSIIFLMFAIFGFCWPTDSLTRIGGGSGYYHEKPDYPVFNSSHIHKQKMNCVKHGRVEVYKCELCGPDGKCISKTGCQTCIREQHDMNVKKLKEEKAKRQNREAIKKDRQLNSNGNAEFSRIRGRLIKITHFIRKTKTGYLYVGYWGHFRYNSDEFDGDTYDNVAIILQNGNIADGDIYCVWFFGQDADLPLTNINGQRLATSRPKYEMPLTEIRSKNTGIVYDFVVSATNNFEIISASKSERR